MSQAGTTGNAVIDALTDKSGKAGGIDINAKVTVGGKEMSIGDLIAAQTAAAQAQARLAELETELKTTKGSVSKMLSGAGTEEDARAMLKSLGYNGDQIEAYVEANFRAPQPKPKPGAKPPANDPTLGDDPTEEEMSTEEKLLAKIESLEARLNETSETTVQDRLRRIGDSLDNELRTAIKNDPYYKSLIAAKRRLDPNVDEGKILGIFAGRARDEATKGLRERRKVAGSFDETWIPGEVEKAVKAVVTEHQTSFVDPKFIGRAPEVVAAEEAVRNAAPVPAPTFDPAKGREALQNDAEKFWADGLSKMALSAGDETNV